MTVLNTSGHEYDNAGGMLFLREKAPKYSDTTLWVHLGANFATRDWREAGPEPELLPSADPQRYLVTTPDLLSEARNAFAGQPGLELPLPASAGAAGELTHILEAGYPSVAGVFGGHRFHHAPNDGLQAISPPLIAAATESFRRLIEYKLPRRRAWD